MKTFLLSFGLLFVTTSVYTYAIDTDKLLQKTLSHYTPKEQNTRVAFAYTASVSRFYHSPKPYDTYTNNSFGRFEIEGNVFKKHDSIFADNKYYSNDYFYNEQDLLSKSPSDSLFLPQTNSALQEQIIQLSFYTPIPILRYAIKHQDEVTVESTKHTAKIEVEIDEHTILMFINKDKLLVDSLQIFYYDSYYGNIKNVLHYKHTSIETLYFPSTVLHYKMNGKIIDTLQTSLVGYNVFSKNDPLRPKDFKYQLNKKTQTTLFDTILTPTIRALQFREERIQSYLIEFSKFLVILEAPLTSEIGQQIVQYAKRTYPSKPIKYVCYSHHHPHYTGGLRPFVHNGTTIVTYEQNKNFLQELVQNSHSLNPDSLEFSKKNPQFITYDSTFTIADENDSLHLFHFGIRSNHTYDYTIFYKNNEKVLLEGDVVWITTDSVVKKAGKGQKELFEFINEKAIPVETIYQAWPVMSPKYKTIIPFSELKASTEMK